MEGRIMDKAERMHRSTFARLRRQEVKKVIQERTENFYSKMRRLRKKSKQS